MAVAVTVLQLGAAKAGDAWPYTICFVANPWIEAPENSGEYVVDPITNRPDVFEERVAYTLDSIFGRLPGQAETMFTPLADQFRVVSVFDDQRPREDEFALVAHDNTNIVVARQPKFGDFLRRYEADGLGTLRADVAFAITASASHDRSSAWFTLDNDGLSGRAFRLDAKRHHHRHHNLMPGTVALHISATSLVGLHEFSHAASSWTNGKIGDLYIDGGDGLNKRRPRPAPERFCVYDGKPYAVSMNRGGTLDYPSNWSSYHPELADPDYPAIMDDFWQAAGQQYELCRHDHLTRQFLLDRVQAIMSR